MQPGAQGTAQNVETAGDGKFPLARPEAPERRVNQVAEQQCQRVRPGKAAVVDQHW